MARGRKTRHRGMHEPAHRRPCRCLRVRGRRTTAPACRACATLLGLDRAELTMAMSIAASRASGLIANIGTMTKALHCGDAAMRGLEAALLAAGGFTADSDAIGSPRGYGRAYYGEAFDPS